MGITAVVKTLSSCKESQNNDEILLIPIKYFQTIKYTCLDVV